MLTIHPSDMPSSAGYWKHIDVYKRQAYSLAILDSDDIAHPRLECVFTVDEEVGMLGAEKIDLSMFKGHQVLNIDSDVEGTFLPSCAGGVTAECSFPLVFDEAEG